MAKYFKNRHIGVKNCVLTLTLTPELPLHLKLNYILTHSKQLKAVQINME